MASKLVLFDPPFLSPCVITSLSQGDPMMCITKPLSYQSYLNGTGTPPGTCCAPLSNTTMNDQSCLCAIFYNKNLLKQFNITQEEALNIVPSCGLTSPDLSLCKHNGTYTPPPSPIATSMSCPSSTVPSSPSSTSPPPFTVYRSPSAASTSQVSSPNKVTNAGYHRQEFDVGRDWEDSNGGDHRSHHGRGRDSTSHHFKGLTSSSTKNASKH